MKKYKFVSKTNADFINGNIYEGTPATRNPRGVKLICFLDADGEEYGYPSSWFEEISEDSTNDDRVKT